MRLTEPKIRQITLKIVDELTGKKKVFCLNKEVIIKKIFNSIFNFLSVEDEINDFVRSKIKSMKKVVTEGGREWEILYKKYFEEELKKRNIH